MQDKLENSKKILQKALAEVVRENRLVKGKSIHAISAEIMMSKSIWQALETAKKDPQFSTIWRVSEALEIPLEKLIQMIKAKLGEDFTLID